ncbi:salicylate monooxygenase [Actinopolyspora erythraea]|uniref:Salicylate monooxygenase n=1 Tax=Actinopolyspora erythraea TaxID=414996 RepID=A0A099D9X4_9ACTN|nr:FAD-dependent monooxygenase [Actinopolyspora erythraea]ASU80371.1 salicylate monooxygenase [Actinopolyspora erythraea]KGI82547.1 salicylate monooxygenase [Actinopolyspora erythraea]
MRVLVIGGGLGGLAVAKGLLDNGHRVRIYEHAEKLRDGGAGVTVWSNGTAALRGLGIPLHGVGRQLHSLRAMTATGRMLWEADLDEVTERLGSPTVEVPRRELLYRMAEALPSEVFRFGKRCVGVREFADHAVAEFADGTSETGDVIVGADGQRSMVRRTVLGGEPARLTGWASWQGLTRSDLPIAYGYQTLNIAGRDGHCGLIPAGEGLLHWWFDMPWREDRAELTVADLRAAFTGWPDPVEELLGSISDEDLGFFPHIRHQVPKVWGGPRTTLIGDAAHAMPPAVAQAANQTMEDAWLLSCALADTDGANPEPMLREYEQQRRPRVAKVSRTAALTSAQRRTPLQRIGKFPRWIATRSQVITLRSGSNILRGLTPPSVSVGMA